MYKYFLVRDESTLYTAPGLIGLIVYLLITMDYQRINETSLV
jgi:hypothetical protein